MINIEMIVSGVVQGVGFRYYTERTANKYGINGYVKNRYDGTVYIVASGDKENMDKFVAWVKIGPRSAAVSNVKINELNEPLHFRGFSVKY